ncbi:SnoaL-like domain-containing protein [Chitinophaga alhagiae]|uniref:SnoaL-like domain-containing protein n=1 Tax=Chitinophaga alhagiae TaxID=2203219 RepID=UPI000E5ACF41|nr:SnoaL-like domain-containing protein [Chitinophaga alhagiae]
MNTPQIAARLVELCRNGQFETAQQELFADDVISIEPYVMPGFEKETKGLEANMAKARKFDSMLEATHSIKVSEPLVTGHVIAFTLEMDVTMKGQERSSFNELCVYHVKDGKVISEQFFM